MTLGSPFIGFLRPLHCGSDRPAGRKRQLLGGNRRGEGRLVLSFAGEGLGESEGEPSLGDDGADRAIADTALRPLAAGGEP
jgi:hypothetical protein